MPDPLTTLHAEIVACRACPRLPAWREEVARTKRRSYQDWDYWGKPVPGFGDPAAQLLLGGIAFEQTLRLLREQGCVSA